MGNEEIHVTELVRSRTVGDVENVPSAIKFPVSPIFPTEMELGMMVSNIRPHFRQGCRRPIRYPVTVSVADAVTTPVNPVMVAVMVVLPAAIPVATPALLMVATAAELDVHVTWSVTS